MRRRGYYLLHSKKILDRLRQLGDPVRAGHLQRFFKTGKGEYAEGDKFLGLCVPAVRKLVREYGETSLDETLELLKNPIHEARLLALFLLVAKYSKGGPDERSAVYLAYLAHTAFVNNWDLVDCSAERIVGAHLWERDRGELSRLARSRSLWERRIAIIATSHFIRQLDFGDTLRIAALLLQDREDLIHKAVGWMLREVGKRDMAVEEAFLQKHYRVMPRTMLRYAIERFPESRRLAYLRGKM